MDNSQLLQDPLLISSWLPLMSLKPYNKFFILSLTRCLPLFSGRLHHHNYQVDSYLQTVQTVVPGMLVAMLTAWKYDMVLTSLVQRLSDRAIFDTASYFHYKLTFLLSILIFLSFFFLYYFLIFFCNTVQ